MKRIRVLMLVVLLALAITPVAFANEPVRVVITDDDIARQPEGTPPSKNWVLYTRNAGVGAFVQGPEAAPAGVGSLDLRTPAGADKVWLFNYDHVGTALADINAISYSTYRTAGNLQQVTSINIEIDFNGPNVLGGYSVLVFEPVYNTTQGTVVYDEWQTWDAFAGGDAIWWSSRAISGVCAFSCYVTWNTIVAANPDAIIGGGFGVNQGTGNPELIAATDALTLGYGTTFVKYDFEPYRTATDKEQCKNGGWQTVKRADGSSFKNQGQCVAYVNSLP